MKLGEKLRQARLEAGLSQRALCGDRITRNMLSQIENGTANPSMATLQYLATALGKPMGYFLEESGVQSGNVGCMLEARQAYAARQYDKVLQILQTYENPDALFDEERHYLYALAALAQAEHLLPQNPAQAERLLESVRSCSIYYTEAMHQRRRLLLHRAWKLLEEQCRQAEDFKQAYFYACKLRES